MCGSLRKYKNTLGPYFLIVLLFSCKIASSQIRPVQENINSVSDESIDIIRTKIPPFFNDTLSAGFSTLKQPVYSKDKNELFYDTLKVRASKNKLTKEIYGALVVNKQHAPENSFAVTSDANYKKFEGKRIRNIIIQRLDVFGTDINAPESENARSYEKVLNKTHFNTSEKIIRKNLLFTEGDLISPLTLSDNERLLRQLPYINDARITIVEVSDDEADVIVYTRDVFSLGASYSYKGLKRGSFSIFDKNILGVGHEFGFDVPFDSRKTDSPGFGIHYYADNIAKTFINLRTYYLAGLGSSTYGFDLSKKLISATTKYAGGISVKQMYTTEDFDTSLTPLPLKYNLQDYWVSRSFLLNKDAVSRFIIGARYINNNVFEHPKISPESYHNIQRYRIYLASAAFSLQKYTKTSLIYSYGRTEDVPYGTLLEFTAGKEYNEFKTRNYLAGQASYGNNFFRLGYFYLFSGYSVYLNHNSTEQGLLSLRLNYFSNLLTIRNSRIRNFIQVNYTRGYSRYTDEYLKFNYENGFSGFRNDSVNGNQRLTVSLESVLFSRLNLYNFKFAFFAFTDFALLSRTNEVIGSGYALTSIGLGFRIRNENLIFNTLQVRFAYFPNPPIQSRISAVTVSGEQLLRPQNFDPGPPGVIPYK